MQSNHISNTKGFNPEVDLYLAEGCGRCSLHRTPLCKVHTWPRELKELRKIVLECGLREDFKWSQPCYTYNNRNILLERDSMTGSEKSLNFSDD
jgi:uncharacterized protein YdeI (YjbR/CyaY-like superfamily)